MKDMVVRVHVTLLEADPAIWRRIELPADATLERLHDVIQVVMGWQDYHLHHFEIGGSKYGRATPEDPELADERKLKLAGLGQEGTRAFEYVYDYGDDWHCGIVLEAFVPPRAGVVYAVRLDRLRALEECRSLLAPLDRQGLLAGAESAAAPAESIDEDELLAELGGAAGSSEITELRHVRTSADKRAAEEIANRQKCENFERFKPLFEEVQKEIESGVRQTRPFELKAEIRPGSWFIVGGQKAYVAESAASQLRGSSQHFSWQMSKWSPPMNYTTSAAGSWKI